MIKFVKWVSLTVAILLVLIFLYMRLSPPNVARVTLLNKSNEVIKSGSIDLCGERAIISEMKPKDEFKFELAVHHDCHYEVKISFISGKEISNGIGYVTNGLDSDDTILVFYEKIELGLRAPKNN